MTFYNAAAVAILAFAGIGFGLHGLALWPAVVLHTAMLIWMRRWPPIICCGEREALRLRTEMDATPGPLISVDRGAPESNDQSCRFCE